MRVLESLKEVWGKEALSMALLVEVDRLPMMTWLGNKLRELKIEFRIHVSDAKVGGGAGVHVPRVWLGRSAYIQNF